MRKLILLCIIIWIIITDSYGYSCDQTFQWKLRYWRQYTFYDDFQNIWTTAKWIKSIDVNYTEQYDYNWSSIFPLFPWTDWFIWKNYILEPGDSGTVIKASSTYHINYHPPVRSKNNLVIQYSAKYYERNGSVWNMSNLKTHNECIYYEITWCWDGILDTDQWETCDPTDPKKTGWWAWWCNASCEPIATPVCNAWVTWIQTSPIIPTTPNLCSNPWENVINFSSNTIWNTTSYVWNCTNGTTVFTGWNCSANYTVAPRVCVAWVTWSQTAPISATTANLCSTVWETSTWFTSTVTWNTTNYSWSCTTWANTYSWWNCRATYTTGWWWGSSCQNWPITWSQSSPINASTPGLCFGSLAVWNFLSTVTWNTTNYTWSCAWISWWNCRATYTTSWWWGWGGWWWGGWGGWGAWTYCWDGKVQRPNSNLQLEECDFWNESDWLFCNKDCTYKNNTIPWHCQGNWSCEITIPNWWAMFFWPIDSVTVWAWMNPFLYYSYLWKPFIKNESDYDLYFDELCVIKKDWTTLSWDNICIPAWIIKSGQTKNFPNYPNFVWKTITSWSFWQNTLLTTIKHNGKLYNDAYFVAPLKVRVWQSSIATTWWGTSYVSNTTKIWNITEIANNWVTKANENKNFVWVWVSTWSISSYSKKIKDAILVKKVWEEWKNYNNNISKLSNTASQTITETNKLSDFVSYNWIENVFILKNKNFKVETSTFNNIKWSRTYIVENWNLIINANIDVVDNIAFVVKWWNIQVNTNVTLMDWTYISIEKDSKWGKIEWIGWTTTNILNVTGSLYWNINDLISNRTYVKQNSNNQIDVWTIVSFGSSLFKKPAPLISTFISEYLQANKVSK